MADSILSVTVRDAPFPCAPYQATDNSFRLQIFHCDGKPLFWRGEDFGKPVPLDVEGAKGGRIHGQVKVPPGCYLVRAFGRCENTVTHWAWVNVGCDQTKCVDLVLPGVLHCISGVIAGLTAGTVGERPVRELVPEVDQAIEVLRRVAAALPEDPLPPPLSEEDFRGLDI